MGLCGASSTNSSNILYETPKRGNFGKSDFGLAELKAEFQLMLDPCAPIEAKKDPKRSCCKHFYTVQEDGLAQHWTENSFFNPPYEPKSKNPTNNIELWIQKAITEAMANRTVNVGLIPAYTDADWWHDMVLGVTTEPVRYIRGRIKFWQDGKPSNKSPNFASAIIIYDFRVTYPWDNLDLQRNSH